MINTQIYCVHCVADLDEFGGCDVLLRDQSTPIDQLHVVGSSSLIHSISEGCKVAAEAKPWSFNGDGQVNGESGVV